MSSRGAVRAGDKLDMDLELDLPISDYRAVRAILLPVSSSARHSALLPSNAKGAVLVRPRAGPKSIPPPPPKSLPSPCNSSSEDEGQSLQEKQEEEGCRSQVVLVLKQSLDKEKFTVGASLESDVVLKHLDSPAEQCYINLIHLELYPDPDCGGLKLCNKSLSLFSAESFINPKVHIIQPSQGLHLDCGSWRLNIGQGLDFQIRIMPRPDNAYRRNWILVHESNNTSVLNSTRKGDGSRHGGSMSEEDSMKVRPLKEQEQVKTSDTEPARTVNTKAPHNTNPAVADPAAPESIPRRSQTTLETNPASKESGRAGPKKPTMETNTPIYKNDVTQIFKATRSEIAVAVKLCRHRILETSAKMWRNEVEILKKLDHPSIVKLVHHDAELLSLELEFVGPDLSHFKDQDDMSTMSDNVQHRILSDISEGLKYIHEQGIIHLDIKPQNILLSSDDERAVLCDFGASQYAQAAKVVRYDGGTPCYTPPEYLFVDDKDRKRGFEGDIWAFGVTMLYVCGTIALPRGNWIIANIPRELSAFTQMKEWLDVIRDVREDLPEADAEALALVRAMLERNPTRRITALQLVQRLSIVQSKWVVSQVRGRSGVGARLQLELQA